MILLPICLVFDCHKFSIVSKLTILLIKNKKILRKKIKINSRKWCHPNLRSKAIFWNILKVFSRNSSKVWTLLEASLIWFHKKRSGDLVGHLILPKVIKKYLANIFPCYIMRTAIVLIPQSPVTWFCRSCKLWLC